MNKVLCVVALLVGCLFLTGCGTSKSIITEYSTDGKVVKITETNTSVIKDLTESTKDKTVVVWESGWAACISASTATTQDPTPTVKLFAGKTDKGMVSAKSDQQNWDGIAGAINATKYELNVSTTGITNGSKTEETTAKATTEIADK